MTRHTLCCTLLALAACGGTTRGATPVDDAGTTCGGNIAFDLAVDSPGRVYYGGGQPPWPSQSTCPYWLTIDHEGEALILDKGNCDHSCPAFQPQDAGAQSITWDGTYYPVSDSPSAAGACETPACASAGSYVATFCVAASLGDASPEPPPTCKTVNFVWPPSTANQVISETISPKPDGG